MKFMGAMALLTIVVAILAEGSYSHQEVVTQSLQLTPTTYAQPSLVETSLTEYSGIYEVALDRDMNYLQVRYDRSRIGLDDLEHILTSLGYEMKAVRDVMVD